MFAGQSDILIPEVATAGTSTHEEDLEDVISLIRMRLKMVRVNTIRTHNKKLTRIVFKA